MKITFPAMRAKMGARTYFATTMALSEIPRFFKFNDWESVTPELRAQRVLNESRVPAMAKYVLDNEDGYLFSSITCSYAADLQFVPASADQPDIGQITLELEKMEFVINDGQHRCAAIAKAVKENPELASDRISVLLFPMENLQRMQQMFSDLNKYAQKTSKSLNILYDQRDPMAALTMEVVEEVEAFRSMVDLERISLPVRSPKLFTLTTLYDANRELLGHVNPDEYEKSTERAARYWKKVADLIPDWKRVARGDLPAPAVRQEKISTHAVVLRALGSIGRVLFTQYSDNWEPKIEPLKSVDWRKSVGTKVNPLWDGVCITAGSVTSNRQARVATVEVIAQQISLSSQATGTATEKRKPGRPKKERS